LSIVRWRCEAEKDGSQRLLFGGAKPVGRSSRSWFGGASARHYSN